MITMKLSQLANVLGIKGDYPEVYFKGVSIDTRTLQKDNLFIAIPGNRVDGHEFIPQAQQKGAAAALVLNKVAGAFPQLTVPDVIASLGKMSAHWREQFAIPLIGVTGSNGKTTLKNMIAAILATACPGKDEAVLATQGTYNNHIGLPLTLIRMNEHHRYAVIEMGMNHFGEIEYLTKLAKPQVAVITNAAASHLEGVGDLAGVAKAKAEIFLGLSPNGTAVLNRDDAYYPFWRERVNNHQYLTFGLHAAADVRAILHESKSGQNATVFTPGGSIDINLPLLGKHNVFNMLAATATALAVGVKPESIKQGLESIQAAPGRLQLHQLANGANIIDDTYNANPYSLQAAVNTLTAFKGKRILVLADMKELGQDEKLIHQWAGEIIRDAGIETLFTFGELSELTAKAFGKGAYHFTEQKKLIHALKPLLSAETTILVKGSRSMKMENVIAGLIN